jgi:small-conductance mechanosensitive channel
MDKLIEFIQTPTGTRFLTVLGAVFVIFLVTSLMKRFIPKYVLETDTRYKARRFTNFIGYSLIMLVLMFVYSNRLTGLSVFLGVAGAVIAFALQELIASMGGFIAINLSRFFKVGDRFLRGGIKGDVIDIGVLRTSLMEIVDWVNSDLYTGRIVLVAKRFIFKEPVFNYSGDFPFLWYENKVPIKTDGDFEYAREQFLIILNEVHGKYIKDAKIHWAKMTEKLMLEKAKVEPSAHMVFDENWITFVLRYVLDYKARRSTKDQISTKALPMIRDSGGNIEVSFAAFEITAFPSK